MIGSARRSRGHRSCPSRQHRRPRTSSRSRRRVAIARRAGLAGAAHPIAAAELDSLGDEEFAARLQRAGVIGRVEPSMKARIIRALRARGRYVAMIGDGVNDILAIRAAQLGIAMESGSSASRAVADLVLLGDRFAVLPQAVAEGRRIVDGMLRTTCLLRPADRGHPCTAGRMRGCRKRRTRRKAAWLFGCLEIGRR
ncbi:MAG: HAD-IC family P-type ATPase [Chloroflexota bacterium]|nr:HAD-IC family P-type ATPase [Chloroflexota bacterium]